MSREALLRLLHQRIGLDADSLGERVLNDALAESRASLGVADDEALHRKALANPDAFLALVERFVVPESWFFRASDQYADLVRFAKHNRDRRPLRVLSLPCASGEEAYSAVIALVEAGLRPEDIDVLGIDISKTAVERALAGIFRSSALRGKPLQDAWVQPRVGGFAIATGIRRSVRFRVGNALDSALLDASETFDVVFCRNLLIYLHPEARARVLKNLLASLVPGGLLFAGQAEVLHGVSTELRPFEGGCPLSYIRSPPTEAPAESKRQHSTARKAKPASSPASAPVPARAASVRPKVVELTPQELADAGRLDEARDACTRLLQGHPEDIETLFLLGLIETARANLGAADEVFARVCYLDRDHIPAIDHRIALAQRLGRLDQAADLRKRAQRLRKRLGGAP
ncbi:MAG TPA: CheR family methyltransferase [Xanthomonadaceae bacterium]|nr:CheR family methyltransferase [Xanthomonadaceae bacterium]